MSKMTWILYALALAASQAGRALADDPGEAVYKTTCITCHGADGKGALPGMPDFTQKSGVLSASDLVLLKRITEGYQSANSPMAMPPKGGDPSLTDEQIRLVLSHLRHEFGR